MSLESARIREADSPRTLLITGASSGIGLALAESLGGEGHVVYATARKPADLHQLSDLPNVRPLCVDVRDSGSIFAAVTCVRKAGAGLDGLVNNAGVGGLGPLHAFPDADLFDLFDVNVFGVHRMTNAFLDLLLESKGRIIVVGSQGGVLSRRYFGPYSMTKHAIEAYVVALADELCDQGISVSVVQPGGIVSSIGENSHEDTAARFRTVRPCFKAEAEEFLGYLDGEPESNTDEVESKDTQTISSPDIVTSAVCHALFDPHPRIRYLVGTRSEGDRVLRNLITKFLDANEAPTHGYDRDRLIAFLDEEVKNREGSPGGAWTSPGEGGHL